MQIRLAFAVNLASQFEAKHFGDADKYLIFEWNNHEFVLITEKINRYKNYDENKEHGSQKKGSAIVNMLKDSGVKALVSKQFGKNIQIVNRHFIPIIIYNENPMELLPVLKDYVKKIENALNNNHEAFKTCIIKNGEFKTIIKNNNFMG